MGCGESKQAVATENTLVKSQSKNLENNRPIEKPANDVPGYVETNVKENGKKIGDADKKESEGGIENIPSKKTDDEESNGGGGNVKESGVDENVVVMEENIKKKKNDDDDDDDDDHEGLLKGGEKEKQLLVSNESPKENDDHDHEVETIESIISEGISGRSDYYSPRAKGHEEKDAEAKLNKEKVSEEVVLKVDEGKAMETPTDETKSSGEENISATAKNETANAASAN
ncbi:hypothetical protein OROGR_008896 [Orobanche gracilis]